jgi:hypothetical protein
VPEGPEEGRRRRRRRIYSYSMIKGTDFTTFSYYRGLLRNSV